MTNPKATTIIGLEVHVELTTKSKMFCGCPAAHFGQDPNTQTCPVCLGLPGALPVPNQQAIEDTIKIGLALNCEINQHTHFDRKQYFYPDLSKGYQISQYDEPLCHDGYLDLDSGKRIRLERIHLEEDTGKLQHTLLDGEKVSLVDFNRSGVPLVEIVSYPELTSAIEAKEYLKKIHQIIRELNVSAVDLEKGQMRLEPTVNLLIENETGAHYTPLVELKNINSFNFAALAIDYEVGRQLDEFNKTGIEKTAGNKQTRGYDSVRKITFPQRQKEEANDYRYFPEPDIPPLVISPSIVEKIRSTLPQLPSALKQNLLDLGISAQYADLLIKDKIMYQALLSFKEAKDTDLNRLANFFVNRKINPSLDRQAIITLYQQLTQLGQTDTQTLLPLIEKVLADNPKVVAEYRQGKVAVIGFFVGQIMRQSGGQVDAKTVTNLLLEKLGSAQ